jgi:hypothetical protein
MNTTLANDPEATNSIHIFKTYFHNIILSTHPVLQSAVSEKFLYWPLHVILSYYYNCSGHCLFENEENNEIHYSQ